MLDRTRTRKLISCIAILIFLVQAPLGADDFIRGDCSPDSNVNIADVIQVLIYIVGDAVSMPCLDACDINDDGSINIVDPVYLLHTLFAPGSSPPLPPFPNCGSDPTGDVYDCVTAPGCP